MERSTIFNGKIHYFDWAIFNSYVKLPEGTGDFPYQNWFLQKLALLSWEIIYINTGDVPHKNWPFFLRHWDFPPSKILWMEEILNQLVV